MVLTGRCNMSYSQRNYWITAWVISWSCYFLFWRSALDGHIMRFNAFRHFSLRFFQVTSIHTHNYWSLKRQNTMLYHWKIYSQILENFTNEHICASKVKAVIYPISFSIHNLMMCTSIFSKCFKYICFISNSKPAFLLEHYISKTFFNKLLFHN